MRQIGSALPTVPVVTSLDQLLPGQAALLDNGTDPPRIVRKRLDGSVPALANAVSEWPVFVARAGAVNVGQAFTKIPLEAALTDTHGGFDSADSVYVIPQTGAYRFEMKIRYADGTPGGIGIGIGAGAAAVDDSAFLWGVTAAVTSGTGRNGLLNQRIRNCVAGERIRLYSYCDDPASRVVSGGELTIDRIR